MSRKVSSTARSLGKMAWKVRSNADVTSFITNVEDRVVENDYLAEHAVEATIDGDPHETRRRDGTVDPLHVSGKIFSKSQGRLASFHAYDNGDVSFGRIRYKAGGSAQSAKQSQGKPAASGTAFESGIAWRMNEDNTCAMWFDGKAWQFGQWSDEHGLWIAYYEGNWFAWQ